MGEEGDDDGGDVEEHVDDDGPYDGEPPDIVYVVECVYPRRASIVDGLHVEGWEPGRPVSFWRSVEERHLRCFQGLVSSAGPPGDDGASKE